MKRTPWLLIFVLLAVVTFGVLYLAATPPRIALEYTSDRPAAARVENGLYLVRLAGCMTCHTDEEGGGKAFAGGRAFTSNFGTFYAPNITPDVDTGLGRWSEEDFVRAMRYGISRDGHAYFPVFPYTSYANLTDGDLLAMYAYLKTVKPVKRANTPHALPWYLARASARLWQITFFRPGGSSFMHSMDTPLGRGEYLANAVAHCGECHTPRNVFGATRPSRHFAGVIKAQALDGKAVPNITRSFKSGIGKWGATDLRHYFQTGQLPDGDYVGGSMAEVIDNGLKYLSADDSKALATYLRSVPERE